MRGGNPVKVLEVLNILQEESFGKTNEIDESECWTSGWTSTFYLSQACQVQLQVSLTPLSSRYVSDLLGGDFCL